MPADPGPKVVEVRIHGIGGEPASHLLADPHPILVAGDDISGFHVARARNEGLDIPQRRRQALSWGGNTSGSWKNALWILLLPFALVNVAGYMHRPGGGPTRRMRWLALTVTLATVLLAAATAYDVIAMQCGGAQGCVERIRILAPYLWQLRGESVFGCLDTRTCFPSRRLGLATAVPLGLLALLWFAGRYAYKDLEAYLNRHLNGDAEYPYRLTDVSFWNGYEPAFRARLIHLSAGRGAIAGALAWSIYNLAVASPAVRPAAWLAAAALVLVAVCAAVVVLPVVYRSEPYPPLKRLLSVLQLASWAVLGGALGVSAAFAPGPQAIFKVLALVLGLLCLIKVRFPGRLPELLLSAGPFVAGVLAGVVFVDPIVLTEPLMGAQRTFFAGLFSAPYQLAWGIGILQAVLILCVFVTPTRPAPRQDRAGGSEDLERHPFNGRGDAVLSTLAVFMVLAVAAGVHRGVANYVADPLDKAQAAVRLNSEPGVGPAPGDEPIRKNLVRAVIPWWYETTAHVLVFVLAALVISGLLFKRGLRSPVTEAQLLQARAHLQSDPVFENKIEMSDAGDRRRLTRVVHAWGAAAQLVRVDVKVARSVWLSVLFGAVMLVIQAPPWTAGMQWRRVLPFAYGRPLGGLATFSLWLVGLGPLLAILALRAAAQKQSWRRQIGRLWDVLMFWPRTISPFAPPCYSERVVPQLRLHIDRLHQAGSHVVVAGHSQGSVIAAAAVAMGPLPDSPAPGRGSGMPDLVVYGSPISILYERIYPAYFGAQFYEGVQSQAGGWHHLFARTDIFSLPFWNDEPADVTRPCPVCGFLVTAQAQVQPRANRADYRLVDPVFWDWPTREPPRPPIRGHSTYATGEHPRFEEQLQTIATRAYDKQLIPD